MNQNNTTVICIGAGEVIQFGTYFNNSNVYMNTHNAYGIKEKNLTELFNIKHSPNLNKTIDKNSDRDIFFIMGSWSRSDLIDNKDNPIYSIGENNFYKYSG